jgi:hypothetical protein
MLSSFARKVPLEGVPTGLWKFIYVVTSTPHLHASRRTHYYHANTRFLELVKRGTKLSN